MNSFHYLFKFIVIGDSAVGKSSIVLQFIDRKFKPQHDATIGVEFGSKITEVKDKTIKLQIWDTAGQENFRSITRSYYRSAIGALLVYDITRRETFNHAKNWLKEVKTNGNSYIEIILVGNKNDLEDKRQVTEEEGKLMAAENHISFIQINATDYNKVVQAFTKMSESVLAKVDNGVIPLDMSVGVRAGDIRPKTLTSSKISGHKKKGCC